MCRYEFPCIIHSIKAFLFLIIQDIDECATKQHTCGEGICVNTIGAYKCVCPEGYTLIDSEKKCIGNF